MKKRNIAGWVVVGLSVLFIAINWELSNIKESTKYDRMVDATVTIGVTLNTETGPRFVIGSGVYINRKGHILTCAHLFDRGQIVEVLIKDSEGAIQKVTYLYRDDDKDLALLKSWNRPRHYVSFGSPPKVGDVVYAVGSPLGLSNTLTHGIISHIGQQQISNFPMNQSDAFINPGNSGGPLFNEDGQLIGINSRMLPIVPLPIFNGLGFSVRLEEIKTFLDIFRGIQ